ncbi:MAG TPA: ATP-dependent DNA helicase [Bacteroidia bacterium]|nr:ATP-dependent DNA helicase [Bacteroidia bacterium]
MVKQATKYDLAFNEALTKLNAAQRKAVDAIEGPVLVIAGPGTGKTQILATRIGKILQETDTQPHNILCLTYTDTGRVEMRNRLFTLIGPAAYRVNIHTFHSFCNEVIQDNLSFFGKQSLEAISELEEVELYQQLLDSVPPESPIKKFKGDNSYEISRIKGLFSLMKKEAWAPEFLNERIDKYLQELPTKEEFIYKRSTKDYKAGEPKVKAIEEETQKIEVLRAAVNLYPRYLKMMSEMGRYTFDDMILWVLAAFKENNNMLLTYQEKYLYFLVDEFQDTSGSQNKLLKYLIDFWESPNVFVVGDDDQSIFSFQDANVENIRHFASQYEKDLQKVVLVENYRSTQAILDIAKKLIEHNKERIVNTDSSLDKNLVSANPKIQQIKTAPELVEYANSANEAIGIASAIDELIKNGVSPKEIAVIYRNHRQVADLAAYLERKKIGINMKRNVNLLELPFIQKILSILKFIALENDFASSGDELLFEILHFDFFKIPSLDIAKISMEVWRKKFSSRKEEHSIRIAIGAEKDGVADLFTQAEVNEIKRVSRVLEGLITKMNNVTLQELFEEVIREAGILNHVVNSPEKPWLMQVLTGLFNFIKSETRKDPSLTLKRLLEMLDTMNKHFIRLDLTKISASDNGVNLVTAHGSKGTEYEYVFLIGCNKNVWDEKNSSSSRTYKLPDNLSESKYETDELEESRRLFYVAITRAKTNLVISYPVKDDKGRALERSAFIGDIMENSDLTERKAQVDDTLLTEYLELQYLAKAIPEIELVDKKYIDRLLENYSLSVTHLSNYLECPIKFYYQNLIRVPAAKSESMAFGSAIHVTLQALFEKMKANNNIFQSKEAMLDDFRAAMYRNRESFTKEQYQRRIEYGEKILPAYYDFYFNKWNKFVIVERAIRNVEVEGIPLNGKLDKLEFNGKVVNVVDYKTGRYDNARKKLKRPGEGEPNGGDYWRQAVFYKILLDHQQTNDWQAVSTEFDFIEPVKDEYKKEKIDITVEDIEIVTAQIIDTWEKIHKHEFSKGCGKEDCHWCNFVKDNHLHVALHEAMDEE